MPQWTLLGLLAGKQTTPWPLAEGTDGQAGFLGMPRYRPELCTDALQSLRRHLSDQGDHDASVDRSKRHARRRLWPLRCLPALHRGLPDRSDEPVVRLGLWRADAHRLDLESRCELRPRDRDRNASGISAQPACPPRRRRVMQRLRVELQALNNPFYNLHRLGIFFTASPRFADLLLVTGPVTNAMLGPAAHTLTKQWLSRAGCSQSGTCAVSGGIAEGGYASGPRPRRRNPGRSSILPGCPPNPAAIIQALLMFLDRAPQRVKGGQLVE